MFLSAEISKLDILLDKINSAQENLQRFANYAFNQPNVKDFLIACNQANLREGERPDNTQIEKEPIYPQIDNLYERYTKYLRKEAGKQIEFVDLNFKGDFYESLYTIQSYDKIYIDSKDPLYEKLHTVWGDILGINDEQVVILVDKILKPMFENFARKYFND